MVVGAAEGKISTSEYWKPVVGFPGYEVSDLGHVRSNKFGRPMVMFTQVTKQGYIRVMFRNNGRHVGQLVHKLVLEAFVGERPEGHICKWKNNLRCDNRVSNLRWVLRLTAGVVAHPDGKEPTMAKLTAKEVREIFRSDGGLQELAERYDVSTSAIWRIRTKRSWSKLTESC